MQKKESGIFNWDRNRKAETDGTVNKKSENNNQRNHRVSSLKNRHSTITAGVLLTSIGGIILLLSYLASSLILTFIGLGLTLWGVLLFYMTQSRQLPTELSVAISLSTLKSMNSLIANMGYKGKAVFFYPKSLKGLNQGYLFVHSSAEADVVKIPSDMQLSNGKFLCEDPHGMLMTAPSQSLVDLFEHKLNSNFSMVDFSFLQQKLPKLLIEDLRLVDLFSLEENTGSIIATFSGGPGSELCQKLFVNDINEPSSNNSHFACPVCSALALAICKIKGRPIYIQENTIKTVKYSGAMTMATIRTIYSEVND